MESVDERLALSSLGRLHWLAIAMAVGSAVIHLVLGVAFLPHPMGVAFVLAAAGFFGAVGLVLVDYRRRLLYLAGIPYTAVQIVLWYALNSPAGIGDVSAVEAVDKIAQGILIVALIVLYYRDS